MRWRPSRPSLGPTEDRPPVAARQGVLGLCLLLSAACAEVTTGPVAPGVDAADRPYLRSPLAGYPEVVAPELRSLLEDLHGRLLAGETAVVRPLAAELVANRPELPPAAVLLAQAELVAGDAGASFRRLQPLADGMPSYVAAQLVRGRAAERLGDLPEAFAAYRRVADRVATAARRADELRARALEIVANRLADALGRGALDEAAGQLDLLRQWGPEETGTLESERRLAEVLGDPEAELRAVRRLRQRRPDDPVLRERQADLEIAAGDPGAGISILQEMAAERPADDALAAKLSRARFRWRLVLLPGEVRQLVEAPELSRGEFASLLYWLFPSVRYARPQSARIANDVFDHPFRDEIVRVINLGLMDVDPGLHEFDPHRAVARVTALAAVLRVLAADRPELSCVGAVAERTRISWPMTCGSAAACGLLEAEADCLPSAPLAGGEAVEICRLAHELLGAA